VSEQALNPTPRIRCNYCERRIHASSIVCPNCQRNPRAFYWKRWHVFVLLGIAAVLLIAAAFWYADDLRALVPTGLALNPTVTPTATRAPVAVVLVATPPPPTATRVPPTPTRAKTATASPSLAATNTLTSTRVTRVPQQTETPSPIPTVIPVAAPKLVSPTDGERVIGANKRIELQFQPAQPLGAQEWYRVEVNYLDREGDAVGWCDFKDKSPFEFPRNYFDESSPNVRSFLWRVNVVASNQIAPKTCDAPYDILSAASEVWTFYWY